MYPIATPLWYASARPPDLPSLDSLTVSDILGLATMEPHERATFESSFQGYVDQMEQSRSRRDNERLIKKELLGSRIQGVWEEESQNSHRRASLDEVRRLYRSGNYGPAVHDLNRMDQE